MNRKKKRMTKRFKKLGKKIHLLKFQNIFQSRPNIANVSSYATTIIQHHVRIHLTDKKIITYLLLNYCSIIFYENIYIYIYIIIYNNIYIYIYNIYS